MLIKKLKNMIFDFRINPKLNFKNLKFNLKILKIDLNIPCTQHNRDTHH